MQQKITLLEKQLLESQKVVIEKPHEIKTTENFAQTDPEPPKKLISKDC